MANLSCKESDNLVTLYPYLSYKFHRNQAKLRVPPLDFDSLAPTHALQHPLTLTRPHRSPAPAYHPSMNIDKPLDDMIAEKKKSRGPRRPRGPRNAGAGGAASAAGGAPKAAAPAAAAAAPVHVGDKIIVSNLPTDVNEQQVKELFTTTIGPIRTCSLAYNAQGLSKGTATVHFVKAEHATAAYQQYNKRLIDGSGS
ncbi:hypothetical protein RTBOTA2_000789 [Rhodotorula toruloides]|nr:hypothetical protein RTBOTA2_000789 [Rhodotorula toruloides]